MKCGVEQGLKKKRHETDRVDLPDKIEEREMSLDGCLEGNGFCIPLVDALRIRWGANGLWIL